MVFKARQKPAPIIMVRNASDYHLHFIVDLCFSFSVKQDSVSYVHKGTMINSGNIPEQYSLKATLIRSSH